MKQRPFAVTVLSWLFVAIGAVALGMDVRFALAHGGGINEALIFPVHALAIVAGAFMLRGADWARWLAVLWMAFHVAITVLNAWRDFAFHAIIFAGVTYLLFRADARAWFHTEKAAGS
jgi:hypothetical protein